MVGCFNVLFPNLCRSSKSPRNWIGRKRVKDDTSHRFPLQIKKNISLTRKVPIFICYLSSIPIYVPKKTRIYTQPLEKRNHQSSSKSICGNWYLLTLPKTNRAPEILMVGSDDISFWVKWPIFRVLLLVFRGGKWPKEVQRTSGWWFQPIWKILIKLGIFPK